MKRKTMTPDQKERSDARRAGFRALAKRVAAMTPEERATLARKIQPVSISGNGFSLTNTILLILQCPTGTIFGGFRQWIKVGRCVRKGEHGSMIWCKAGGKSSESAGQDNAEPTSGEVEGESLRFLIGTVFDVSQTEPLIPKDEDPGAPIHDIHADPVPERLELCEAAERPADPTLSKELTFEHLTTGAQINSEPEHYEPGTAVVGADIADAFGMRGLPNTVIIERDGTRTMPAQPQTTNAAQPEFSLESV